MKGFDWVTRILVIVGALNWGLMAIDSSWNLVTLLFGNWQGLVTTVYALVGLSAVWEIVRLTRKK